MVVSIEVYYISIDNFKKLLEKDILKLQNFSFLQNEIIEISPLINTVGEDILSLFQDNCFNGIDGLKKIDIDVSPNFFPYDSLCCSG